MTTVEVLAIVDEMRARGAIRFRYLPASGEVEVAFAPPMPKMPEDLLREQAEVTDREKKLRRAAQKEATDPARKKSW